MPGLNSFQTSLTAATLVAGHGLLSDANASRSAAFSGTEKVDVSTASTVLSGVIYRSEMVGASGETTATLSDGTQEGTLKLLFVGETPTGSITVSINSAQVGSPVYDTITFSSRTVTRGDSVLLIWYRSMGWVPVSTHGTGISFA